MRGHHHHGHAHGHSHDHGHHDHSHGASERAVAVAAALTGGFMLVEIAGGLVSGSLALLADAGHMALDFAALALAWFGFRLARRPADGRRSYGFDRFSVLVAFVNGLALFAVAAWITVEAIGRLADPQPILTGTMLLVAVLGLVVNVAAFWVLSRGDTEHLNMRAALLHVVGDMLGSVAAIAAALAIMATGWFAIDPILSVLVSLIILRAAWHVVRQSGHILLEGAPAGLDTAAVREAVLALPFVNDAHHVHVWSISQSRPMVTLHACVDPTVPVGHAVAAIKKRLAERFALDHCTVEIEHGACADADADACADACADAAHHHGAIAA